MTVSVLRELFSRLRTVQVVTVERIARERNETLRRKETARISAWHQKTNTYPPRRQGAEEPRRAGRKHPRPPNTYSRTKRMGHRHRERVSGSRLARLIVAQPWERRSVRQYQGLIRQRRPDHTQSTS